MNAKVQPALQALDSYTQEFCENPSAHIATLGPGSIAAQGRHGAEFLTYESVRHLYNDRQFRPLDSSYFADQGASPIVQEFVEQGLLLMMPGERHARVRRILIKGFTPRRIAAWRPMMREVAQALLTQAGPAGRMEFVEDFSFHYSIAVISRFIGVPLEDIPIFSRATITLRLIGERPLAPHLPALDEGLATIRDYVSDLVARRRASPQDDFVSDILAVQQAEGSLNDSEVVWGIANLLLAGHDTTRFQLASVVRAAVENNVWERLATEPNLIEAAVWEGMRLYPVTLRNNRVAFGVTEYEGIKFQSGEFAVLNISAAGRDPVRFANSDRYDLNRKGWDIGFGYGPHFCLGHALALTEMVEALRILTQQLTDIAFDGPPQPGSPDGPMLYLDSLKLRYRPR